MKSLIKSLALMLGMALLASCSTQSAKNASGTASVTKVKPQRLAHSRRYFRDFNFPEVPVPRYRNFRSVDDVLASYGDYAVTQLKPYFDEAGVDYPPNDIALIGLKEERKLELWARGNRGKYRFIREYDIKAASGLRGPKLRQGDRQVPEGIYRIVHLNPASNYHLSMKLDYPNDFDKYHADIDGRSRPGNDIFIHGKAVSAGCLAMGDRAIEELFVLVAHVGKENTKVVIAPHDPRVVPLETEATMPEWTNELYQAIEGEILEVSNAEPVKLSSNRQIRTDRSIR